MALYTFFLDYKGGTYISQVRAARKDLAPKVWAIQFDLPSKKQYKKLFEPKFQEKLIASLDLNIIFAVEGVRNTWTFHAYRLDNLATINFTKTVEK